jgi:hypothetical protein
MSWLAAGLVAFLDRWSERGWSQKMVYLLRARWANRSWICLRFLGSSTPYQQSGSSDRRGAIYACFAEDVTILWASASRTRWMCVTLPAITQELTKQGLASQRRAAWLADKDILCTSDALSIIEAGNAWGPEPVDKTSILYLQDRIRLFRGIVHTFQILLVSAHQVMIQF